MTNMDLHKLVNKVPVDGQGVPSPHTSSTRSSVDQDLEDVEGSVGEQGFAGMGKARMTLLKLGCLINVDAPHTVSCQVLQ